MTGRSGIEPAAGAQLPGIGGPLRGERESAFLESESERFEQVSSAPLADSTWKGLFAEVFWPSDFLTSLARMSLPSVAEFWLGESLCGAS